MRPFNRRTDRALPHRASLLLGAAALSTAACGSGPAVDPNMTMYACGAQWIDVAADRDGARVIVGADVYEMSPVPTASGARYVSGDPENPDAEFWERNGEARLTIGGERLPTCQRSDRLYASYLPISASGNGGWSLRLDADSGVYEEPGMTVPFAVEKVERHREAWIVTSDGDLSVAVTQDGCAASGLGVAVTLNGTTKTGCTEADNMGFDGDYKGMLDGSEVTMAFDGARLAASAGCNRISGGFAMDGDTLTIGNLMTTRMACLGAAMEAEQKLLGFLAQPLTVEQTTVGGLVLTGGETRLELEKDDSSEQ